MAIKEKQCMKYGKQRIGMLFVYLMVVMALMAGCAEPGETQEVPGLLPIARVSVDGSGAEADGHSIESSISADGRYVAFCSDATNLVPGDTNGTVDLFVYDRKNGGIERVSVGGKSVLVASRGRFISISADGRYIAFTSTVSYLVAGDTNSAGDVFVYDRQSGVIERVSVDGSGAEGNGGCDGCSISADGRYVAFGSIASNLVAGDTNAVMDVFVYDRQNDGIERVSVSGKGDQADKDSYNVSISADGRYVAFCSAATNLVTGDANGATDVFVYDRDDRIVERVSVDAAGNEVGGGSYEPSISADGRYVAFSSDATNLVPGDTNGCFDVFVRDRQSDSVERVSVGDGGTEGNSYSDVPSISADGRYVAFCSDATNLVPGDTNGCYDIFVYDRQNRGIERASADGSGAEGNGYSYQSSISADARYVAFTSSATNLVPNDTNGMDDIFVAPAH